jgi:uracil-DNA glycosylase
MIVPLTRPASEFHPTRSPTLNRSGIRASPDGFCSTILNQTVRTYLQPVKTLDSLLEEVRACRACADVLPLGPRPVVQISATARILIASQAPGTKVHDNGIPFSDASGDRLREWMGVRHETFYDEQRIAILPMGLCYPGRLPSGGDAPPRPECAPLWRDQLLAHIPHLRLTLLVGTHAQTDALGPGRMTERVMHFRDHLPAIFPLPHPSWRTRHWAARNPWFDADALPALRDAVQHALA